MLISALQPCISVIYTHTHTHAHSFSYSFHCSLSQDIEYSFLWYTIAPYCLFILYITPCMCLSQTPTPSRPLPLPLGQHKSLLCVCAFPYFYILAPRTISAIEVDAHLICMNEQLNQHIFMVGFLSLSTQSWEESHKGKHHEVRISLFLRWIYIL